jgi:hypothetical protein
MKFSLESVGKLAALSAKFPEGTGTAVAAAWLDQPIKISNVSNSCLNLSSSMTVG